MRITVKELREIVGSGLAEAQHHDDIVLADGKSSRYGSSDHIKEMETVIPGLEALRNQQRKGTAARATYAAAVRLLKAQVKGAQSRVSDVSETEATDMTGEPTGNGHKKLPEKGSDSYDDAVFPRSELEEAELDERGTQGIGVYGAAGHGRYVPGHDE